MANMPQMMMQLHLLVGFHDGPSILATRAPGQEVSSANSRTYALTLQAGQISAMFAEKTNSLSVATSCANTTDISVAPLTITFKMGTESRYCI